MCLDNLSSDIDLKYLEHYLKNYDFKNIISGSAQPQITRENINKVQLKLYSFAEQKHIATVLDKCSAVIAKHKAMLAKYDTLIKSRFVEIFGENPICGSGGIMGRANNYLAKENSVIMTCLKSKSPCPRSPCKNSSPPSSEP